VMIGNSSSGIIEAATFATPVVNVGSRQQGRERSENVLDVDVQSKAIEKALKISMQSCKTNIKNIYGDGQAGQRMLDLLTTLSFDKNLLNKLNAY